MAENPVLAFVEERNEALLSLDEAKLRAYGKKYGALMSDDPKLFWESIHMARTIVMGLPEEAKEISRQWLRARNIEPKG